MANEVFARVRIDQILKDAAWRLTDGRSVRYEYPLDDDGKADYALFDRQGRALAVLEAKSTSVNLSAGGAPAALLGVGCFSEAAWPGIEAQVRAAGAALQVFVRPGWYFR